MGVTACSSVAVTRYCVDGGEWTDGAEVRIAGAGLHWIAYASIGGAGNAEQLRWRSVTTLP
jgi:hypothetical protein